MTAVELFCPMRVPTATHNGLLAVSDRRGKARLVKSQALREAEASWESHLARFAPPRPLSGPLMADVRFCWAADARHPAGTPKATKPDLDNVEKAFWDALQRLRYFVGDQQVALKTVAKLYAEAPGVYVKLEEMGRPGEGGVDAS